MIEAVNYQQDVGAPFGGPRERPEIVHTYSSAGAIWQRKGYNWPSNWLFRSFATLGL